MLDAQNPFLKCPLDLQRKAVAKLPVADLLSLCQTSAPLFALIVNTGSKVYQFTLIYCVCYLRPNQETLFRILKAVIALDHH